MRLPDLVLPAVRLLPALAVFGAVWWVAGAAGASVEASRGSITAAIIARTGWANPEAVFTTARWLATFVAWVVGPLVALALFGALTRGVPVGAVRRWLRPALSWRALAVGALVVIALAWFWPLARGVAAGAAADPAPTGVRRRQDRRRLDGLGAGDRQLHPARRARPGSRPPAAPPEPAQRQAA